MTNVEQLKKTNKLKSKVSNLLREINIKRSQLIKNAGEEIYGKPGDMIVITDSLGIHRQAKILYVDESFWSELPLCVLEIDGSKGEKIKTHINGPDRIVKKL